MSEYQWDQSARLRCLRDYLGLSMNEIAAVLNVGLRAYQNWESGRFATPAGAMDDVAALVHRLDELAGDYASRDTLSIDGMTGFEMRAAGIAAAANPKLQITN